MTYIKTSTYQEFEIILVNDGSEYGSEKIIQQLLREDSRIKYYYKKNGDIVSARNYGLKNIFAL